jgi:hypothetical protein
MAFDVIQHNFPPPLICPVICGSASIVEPDPHAMFARDCGAESIVALMAGACGEGVMLGDYDRIGCKTDCSRAR